MAILDTTLGALFDGVAVSTMLYGVTCAQTFVYFRSGFDDDYHLKLLLLYSKVTKIKSNWTLLLAIPSVLGFAFSMVSIAQGLSTPSFTAEIGRFRWAPTVFGACHAVSDVVVAVLMCYFLYRAGSSSHSCILALAYVITYNAMPNNLIYIGIYLIHPKVYVNSMLASLNGRTSLRIKSKKTYLT
ncbi:hypothetical protein OE88DRAFT_1730213 [Heliocybe sulcata]|uniref:DUF6534 domain-containing protein n=1 Tax=Heliocybe sulcata TaxID=5364 RepID=A0A5C3NKU3_9AGAM|nr:hypothetical protein OE88DRAFT_1730213 [Heliocybe sulcata]